MEEFLARKERKMLEETYGVWREKRLRDVEERVAQMKRRRETEELLQRWKERSMVSRSVSVLLTSLSLLLFEVSPSAENAEGTSTAPTARLVEELHDSSGAHRSRQGVGL